MSNQANYYKIGLFVVLGVAIAIVSVVILGAGSIFEKSIVMETYIDGSVQGLDVGSAVKFRGVQIGRVNKIAVVSWIYDTEKSYILVRSTVPTESTWFKSEKETGLMFKKEMEKGLRVRLAQQGVTGVAYLEVDYLDPKTNPPLEIDWKPQYPYLPSAPSVITQLSESLTNIMRSLEDIKLDGLTGGVEQAIQTMIATMKEAKIGALSQEARYLLAELRETNKHLDKVIVGDKIEKIMADASSTMAEAKKIITQTSKPWSEFLTSLRGATDSIQNLAGKLDSTSSNLPQAVTQAQMALKRLDELLAIPEQDLEVTMRNLRAASENLKDLTANTKKYPSYLLFGDPPPRVRRQSPGQ